MFDNRAFQETAVCDIEAAFKTCLSVLLFAPTGAGKTVIAGKFLQKTLKPGEKAFFIVNKQTLVSQSYLTFKAFGLNPVVLHNDIKYAVTGELMNTDISKGNVFITLVGSYDSFADEIPENINLKYIALDEAHKSTSETFQEFREKFPNTSLLGLSATPGRGQSKEGEKLSEWYDTMIRTLTISELIELGFLVQPEYFLHHKDERIIDVWAEATATDKNKRSIIFTTDTRHSMAVKKAFLDNGIAAEVITSGSDLVEEALFQTPIQRNKIFSDFNKGEIDVLISVGALCEGFDEKLAKHLFILRSIGNIALYHQMVGRVLRAIPGKTKANVHDFYGNVEKYGFIEEYYWDMDGVGHNPTMIVGSGETVSINSYKKNRIHVYCAECSHVYDSGEDPDCPLCGTKNRLTLVTKISDARNYFAYQIGEVAWNKIAQSKQLGGKNPFWTMMDILERCFTSFPMKYKFNDMYFEAFDEDGNLKPQFNWCKTLLSKRKKLKMSDTVELEI